MTEVEGLADLIHAETEAQRKQALIQATGRLSKLYTSWRKQLVKCIANVEAYIDFAEDENIEDETLKVVKEKLTKLRSEISSHLVDGRKGERLREGVRTVVIGAPNAGKSSLVNLLCQKSVSIVTNIAGTTRDIIETHYNIGGYPILLADTAGLRIKTNDIVESEGIQRAKQYLATADLIILVVDASKVPNERECLENFFNLHMTELGIDQEDIQGKKVLKIVNKIDLVDLKQLKRLNEVETADFLPISCLNSHGLDEALEKLTSSLKDL